MSGIKYLKSGSKCSDQPEEILLKNVSEFNLELFYNEIKNTFKIKKCYSETRKQFVSTLYYYSPKAYNFVHSKLNLPHQATLQK